MGITGQSNHSYTFDAETLLKDRADGAETTSAAESLVLDFGGLTPQGVEQVAYTAGVLVVDVDALDGVTGDEFVDLVVQLSDNADFSMGNVVARGVVHLGNALGADGDDQYGTGRVTLGVDNEHNGVLFRFMRLARVVGGTTPSVTYNAFLARKQPGQ